MPTPGFRIKILAASISSVLTMAPVAHADMVAAICQVNDIGNACSGGSNVISSDGVLTLRGFAYDLISADRPQPGGYLTIRNEDTLASYKIPIQRIEARPDLLVDQLDANLTPDQYDIINAGFIAQVFMASLPLGRYSVTDARISMKKAGLVKVDLDASNRAMFQVQAINGGSVRLVKGDGAVVPLSFVTNSSGAITVTGYPAIRDGGYRIEASLPAPGGNVETGVNFAYKRPLLSVPVSMPIVQDFPGVVSRIVPINPLTNRPLNVSALPVVVDTLAGNTVTINGQSLALGKGMEIAKPVNQTGMFLPRVADSGITENQQNINLFVDLPDAPNIRLSMTRWNPSANIVASSSKSAAAVRVEDVDVDAKLTQRSDEKCTSLTTVRPEYHLGQVNGIVCAVQWDTLPEGMKFNPYRSNALTGAVPAVGDNVLSYQSGVVYTDQDTKQTSFYPAKTPAKTLLVAGYQPSPIALTMRPDRNIQPFYDTSGSQYPDKYFTQADPSQPRLAGMVNVKAAFRNVITRVVLPDTSERSYFSSIPESNVALALQSSEPWKSQSVKVESWYEKAPEFRTEQTFDFIGVPLPPVVDLDRNLPSHDKASTIVKGRMGIVKGQNMTFHPANMGQWRVFAVFDKDNTPLGSPVDVNPDGTFSIDLGLLTKGIRMIKVVAQMIDASGNLVQHKILSKPRALVTERGDAIEGSLNARSVSGRVPFMQTVYLRLKDDTLLRSVGDVKWEVNSADGRWDRIKRSDNDTDYIGMAYTPTFTESGSKAIRAVVINRYSNEQIITEPLTLQAYDMPTFKVTAPAVAAVGKPVELVLQPETGFEAEYTWSFVSSGQVENVSSKNGTTFSFTPTNIQSYIIQVEGRQKGAPEDGHSSVKKVVAIKTVNPLIAHASIIGPTTVEVGKTYHFDAKINDVVPTSTYKSYNIKGYWSLPNGGRVDALGLDYKVKAGDTGLAFMTYVDGYPDMTSASTHNWRSWEYVWPTNWVIRMTPLFVDVPAQIRYYVEPVGFDLRQLQGEKLSYTWSLPNHVVRTGDPVAGMLNIDQQGTYQVAVQVADTRGNVVNVMSDQFSILPVARVQTEAKVISKYGESYYAPGSYYISVKVTEVPRGDSFVKNEVMVNGQKVGEFTGSGSYVTFSQPGQYDVVVRTLTKLGNYGEQTMALNVQEPPAPTCMAAGQQTSSGLYFAPACTVDVGYVKSYLWTYDLDGQPQKSTSKTFVATKAWMEGSRIKNLHLTVESDLGAKTEQSIPLQ